MISSLSVLGMPFVDFESGGAAKLAGYAMGLVFWLFLAAGFVFYRLTYKTLGKSVRISDKERPAILKFFSNLPGYSGRCPAHCQYSMECIFSSGDDKNAITECSVCFAYIYCFSYALYAQWKSI